VSIESAKGESQTVVAVAQAAGRVRHEVAVAVERLASDYKRHNTEAAEVKAKHDLLARAAEQARATLVRSLPAGPSPEPERTSAAKWDYVAMRRADGSWHLRDDVFAYLERELREVSGRLSRKDWWQSQGGLMRQSSGNIARAWAIVHGLEAERDKFAQQLTRTTAEAGARADAAGTAASTELRMATHTLIEQQRALVDVMVPWLSKSWSAWTPPETAADTVYIGAVKLRPGQVPPPNQRFGLDASIPVFASVRAGLRISHDRGSRATAHSLGRSILLRALAATPPGKLQLSIFDPLGLGQSVSSLLELGEYDRDLIGGKVWSSSDDLQRLLAEHTAHIELVIQKYLRAEYSTLDEFNAAAGEIAEPYRLLAIFDAPSGFDERSFAELRRIIENGPRCGVSTLLITDQDLECPHGVSLDALPQNLKTIRMGLPFGHGGGKGSVDFELTPDTDAAAPEQVIRSIVHEVVERRLSSAPRSGLRR